METTPGPPSGSIDPELELVEQALYSADPTGSIVASVIRNTLDQLYDGQHTGRWSYDQLYKTEKTHMGTLVEINLQRRFAFESGKATDYLIAGAQVDCKYTMSDGYWTLPPEVIGHLALLVTADDAASIWRAGLIRVTEDRLNLGRNRDAKATLSRTGRQAIRWLWPAHPELPPNLFLQLDTTTRDRIFAARAPRGNKHGQARVNELFRSVQGRIIRRAELATVAQQDDFMKRARSNGGARTRLRTEGILVLGHLEADRRIARALGIPVPSLGELISVRVVRAEQQDSAPRAIISDSVWRVATFHDPIELAPDIDTM